MVACLLVASCSRANGGEPRPRAAPEPAAVEETEAPAEPALPEPDPDSTCGHALACCRAYASAIPDVVEESACHGVLEAAAEEDPDARCRVMTAGWRQALEHLSGEAPEACR